MEWQCEYRKRFDFTADAARTHLLKLDRADSLIGSWLQGQPLSPDSPAILDRFLQDPEARKTRRGAFSWRFSPMKEPSDLERVKRQLWGPKPKTSGASVPLRQQNLELGDQSTDTMMAPSEQNLEPGDQSTDTILAPSVPSRYINIDKST